MAAVGLQSTGQARILKGPSAISLPLQKPHPKGFKIVLPVRSNISNHELVPNISDLNNNRYVAQTERRHLWGCCRSMLVPLMCFCPVWLSTVLLTASVLEFSGSQTSGPAGYPSCLFPSIPQGRTGTQKFLT